MSRAVFFLLVVVAVLSTVYGYIPKKECGKNEEWNACASMCPPKCCQKKPKICPLACKPGCQCKHGYLRDNWDKCVLPCDCKCK